MMITSRSLLFSGLLLLSASVLAGEAGLTLEQAVTRVQKETGGKVLSADTRLVERGRITEYRVKVLTLDGHVRVVPIRTETAKIPGMTDRINKEKH